jgi:hypothetical protein
MRFAHLLMFQNAFDKSFYNNISLSGFFYANKNPKGRHFYSYNNISLSGFFYAHKTPKGCHFYSNQTDNCIKTP